MTLHVALQALLNIGERKQAREAAQTSLRRFERDPKLHLEVATLKVFLSQLGGEEVQEKEIVEGIKSRKQKTPGERCGMLYGSSVLYIVDYNMYIMSYICISKLYSIVI